jgi:hypothetical protein
MVTLVLLAGEVRAVKRKRNIARRANPEIASGETQLNTSFQGIQ